jgi:hypothetical protein
MSTAKVSSKRRTGVITKLVALPSEKDRVMTLRVDVSTAELCNQLRARLRTPRGSAGVRAALKSLIGPPATYRARLGEIQPQVPERLREALRQKAEAIGRRKSNALVLREVELWRRFAVRRRKIRGARRAGRGSLHPPVDIRIFRERGRALVLEGNLVRFTVNAGSGTKKASLVKLIKSLDMNLSEFFSALIECLCNEGQLHDSVDATHITESQAIFASAESDESLTVGRLLIR